MQIDLTVDGVRLVGADGRVELGPARPRAEVSVAGRPVSFAPSRLTLDVESGVLRATGPGGLVIELTATHAQDAAGGVDVRASLRNEGPAPIHVERFAPIRTTSLGVGEDPRKWRTLRNGYQSWAGTRTLGVRDTDADFPTRLLRIGCTDAKHTSPTARGHVRSDGHTVICEPVSGDALGLVHLQAADAFGFVEMVAPDGVLESLEVWSDLDGVALEPGRTITSTVRVVAAAGRDASSEALASVVDAVGRTMRARGADRHAPAGWCSWYYYFAKVAEHDVLENLAVLAEDGREGPTFGCEYVMVDDGHQSRIGDWLETNRSTFPSGMADLARRIRDQGFDAGIWWAPFLVHPDSRVATAHPDWLVRNDRGRPIVGCLNPMWSATTPMRVLDTTHPAVLEHLRHVAGTIDADWGYSIQKLDFLYAAALPGRRFDPTATRARALRLGLEAIREGAGEESFLLGCGSPFGPAIGVVDAMRIGADVTPYWSNPIDRVAGRGRHGLATRNAVVNIATRAHLDRRWWRNDPDCLMVRDTDTKLTEEEVRVLATVIGMTDGMLVVSDRLTRLSPARREVIGRARALAGGAVEAADLFEQELPEVLVARHEDHVDVAVLNMAETARHMSVDLARRGVDAPPGELAEFWTGAAVGVRGGLAHFGELPPHSARVVRVPRS